MKVLLIEHVVKHNLAMCLGFLSPKRYFLYGPSSTEILLDEMVVDLVQNKSAKIMPAWTHF
ncbi:hypothetical protein ACFL3Q_14090, partial [Planctomycetota bacterium]